VTHESINFLRNVNFAIIIFYNLLHIAVVVNIKFDEIKEIIKLCYEVARLESRKINSLSSLKFVFCHGDLPHDIALNLYNKIHNSMKIYKPPS